MQRVEAKKLPNLVLKADLGSPSSKQGSKCVGERDTQGLADIQWLSGLQIGKQVDQGLIV